MAFRYALTARPAAIFAASRVATLVVLALAARLSEAKGIGEVLRSWDGDWYLLAARAGYPAEVPDGQSTIAFFPLFPAAIRAVAALPGVSTLEAALVVNAVAGVAFAIVLWHLVRHLADVGTADRAVAIVSFFPGSVALSLVYSEPLMLALAAGCLYALVRNRWIEAGVLAALATATRPNAVALCAACAWAAFAAVRQRREWPALAAPLLSPLGILGYFGFLWARTGDATAWFHVQRNGWGESSDLGQATLDRLFDVAADPGADLNETVATIGLLTIVGLGVALWRFRPPGEILVYTAVVLALALTSQTLGARPRFVLTAFPLLLPLARVPPVAFATVVGVLAALLAGMAIVTTTTLLLTP